MQVSPSEYGAIVSVQVPKGFQVPQTISEARTSTRGPNFLRCVRFLKGEVCQRKTCGQISGFIDRLMCLQEKLSKPDIPLTSLS